VVARLVELKNRSTTVAFALAPLAALEKLL
jgi:hypothetical protein